MSGPGHERRYYRRQPERDLLYRTLQDNLETFVATSREQGGDLPQHVRHELYGYLDCGILARGAARVACEVCHDSIWVAYSCKGRGFCPACCARRMNDTAAHLVDRVIPRVPVRQWVLSLPFRLRYLCARDASLVRAVLRIFVQSVNRCLRRLCRRAGIRTAQCGSVTAVQRFASSLGLNVHLHVLFLDGVFRRVAPDSAPVFEAVPKLADTDVARVAAQVQKRVSALLEKRGLAAADAADGAPEEDDLFARLCAASVQGRIATGPKAGWRVSKIAGAPVLLSPKPATLCAQVDGFNVHATARIHENDRKALERLCRYMLRPPLARERLTQIENGQLRYELKRPWSDGTTHLLFTPDELIERLCALVPPPKSHLVLYHGVLASHASWRKEILPEPQTPWLPPWEQPQDVPSVPLTPPRATSSQDASPAHRARRLSWAALLKRIFSLEMLKCSRCGGRRKVISFVTDPGALARICSSLGVSPEAPPLRPARPPPQVELDFFG